MPIFREDPDLLRRFRRGDKGALAVVYRAYADQVHRAVRGGFGTGIFLRRPQDCLDVVQDVFVKAFSVAGRESFDGARNYGPFLLAIARNTTIDWMRSQRRSISVAEGTLESIIDPRPPPGVMPTLWDSPQISTAVDRFVQTLAGPLADLHRLRYAEGLSQDDTAKRMGLTRQTVRTLEGRLRQQLAEALSAVAAQTDMQDHRVHA